MKIFGHEPTLVIAVVSQAVVLIGTLGFGWISGDQAALAVVAINAIAGAVNAYAVRPVAPAAFTYAVASIASLAMAYGLEFTNDQLSAVNGFVVVVLALITRNQVSPQDTAVSARTDAAHKPEVDAT